jgi:hypothetical protein
VNKVSIKIIKRKDMLVTANNENQITCEPKPTTTFSGEKTERSLRRKMADTVSIWISEHRENNRIKEVSAIAKLFGDESLLGKTA